MTNGAGEGTMATHDFGDIPRFDEHELAAWRIFADELSTQIATLKRHEFIEVARTDMVGGYHLLFIFTLTGSGRLRCTVDGMAFAHFAVQRGLTARSAQRLILIGLGWRQLRNREFVHDVGKRGIDKLIAASVRALRQVWGIEHSSVLTVRYPFGSESEEPEVADALFEAPAPVAPPVEGTNRKLPVPPVVGLVPNDAADLLEMTGTMLAARLGERITIEQKVIGFETDAGLHTNILVSPQAPRLEFCTVLAHQIPDMDLLGAVIAEHSSRWPDISIVVTKGHVFAVRAMDAAVFSHINLLATLQAWQEFCNDGAIDIIEQLQPDTDNDLDCVLFDQVPERLIDMVDRYSRGDRSGLTPDLIARGCRGNTPMLRRYARICAEQINQMRILEQVRNVAGGSPVDNEGCRRQRQAIELFMPVLIAAITLAAQYNGEREMGRWN